jgi:hypothetical protein
MQLKVCEMTKSANDLNYPDKSSVNGENVSSKSALLDLKTNKDRADPLLFPPQVAIEVKALACQLPSEFNKPLSRFTSREIARLATEREIAASISGTTVWRWLGEDAIKPWQYRSWIFPRDPDFQYKAGLVLDLYHRIWDGKPLDDNDFVISTDEKTSIQARHRIHETLPAKPGRAMKVEAEYERRGALAYLAAWDVNRAKVFGRCENTTGIKPFGRLVDQVMSQEPYTSANRVFWVMDNGSSHRGKACIKRLTEKWPKIVPIHVPVHASWLNQIEIYFSVVQRKVLTPNDFSSLVEVENRLLNFQEYYEGIAKPFQWKFTREDLDNLLNKLQPWTKTVNKCA